MDVDQDNLDAENHIACHRYTFNEMVVAFVNSPLQTATTAAHCAQQESAEQSLIHQLDGRGGYDEFLDPESGFGDWCERKFAKRAIIGTLRADEDEMESFATVNKGSWPGSTFVRNRG